MRPETSNDSNNGADGPSDPADPPEGPGNPTLPVMVTYPALFPADNSKEMHWFALHTQKPAVDLQTQLAERFPESFIAMKVVTLPRSHRQVLRPVLPKVLFLRSSLDEILRLEEDSRRHPDFYGFIKAYRFPGTDIPQPIPESHMHLFRLLTADDHTRCMVYTKDDFNEGQEVEVTGGPFKGYRGHIRRVRTNRRIVVEIQGMCAIALPHIHADLLKRI